MNWEWNYAHENIDLLENEGRKPRETKGKELRHKKVYGDSIEIRPDSIDEREELGYWEVDTVIGNQKEDESILLMLVEWETRFEKIFKIVGQKASDVDQTLQSFM